LNPLVNKTVQSVTWLDHGQTFRNILAEASLKAGLVAGRTLSVVLFGIGMSKLLKAEKG